MGPSEVKFPVAFVGGVATFFEPSDKPEPTYFGGPPREELLGARGRLHHIFSTTNVVFPVLEESSIYWLSLFYGMTFSGCSLEYRKVDNHNWKVTQIKPRRPTRDWPYAGYPPILPYVPLRVTKQIRCTANQFARLARREEMPRPGTIVVIVPPVSLHGVSMWGVGGDDMGVQIIFECDLKRKTVRAMNQCD